MPVQQPHGVDEPTVPFAAVFPTISTPPPAFPAAAASFAATSLAASLAAAFAASLTATASRRVRVPRNMDVQ